MKDTKSIEEQVAQLTEEQKDIILKVGKNYMITLIAVTIPVFLIMIINILGIANVSKYYMIADKLMLANSLIFIAFIIFISLCLVHIRKKYPFYSDKKYAYIKKQRVR